MYGAANLSNERLEKRNDVKIIICLFSLFLTACVSTDSLQSDGDSGDHYVVTMAEVVT